MARGVGILGAERGAKGIDIAEGHGEVLGVELTGNGERGGRAEEVLGVVHVALSSSGGLAGSMVVTWNISPAPSQSLAVMMGVFT